MPAKSFTVTLEIEEGDTALLTLVGPGLVARALRDFVESSVAPGGGVRFEIRVTSSAPDEPPATLAGQIPSLDELARRIHEERRGQLPGNQTP